MAEQTIDKELFALEKEFWQAMKDRDTETVMRLTDDRCIVTGASGVGQIERKALGEMVKSAPYTLNSFKLDDDPKVQQLSDDVAIIAYKVHEDLTVDGKPVSFDAADSSTWVRRDGRWVCALHTEAISGDAYGRDRRA
jgi:hypothetical protein